MTNLSGQPVPADDLPTSNLSGQPVPSDDLPDAAPTHDPGIVQQGLNVLQASPRNLIEGLGQLADIPSALHSLADQWGTHIHNKVFGTNLKPEPYTPRFGPAMKESADALGMPSAEATPGEQIASAGTRGAVPGMLMGPAATLAAGAGSMASEATRQAGGGLLAQTAAGVAVGGAPAIKTAVEAGIKGAVRGGSAGAANMQENLAKAGEAGITLDAAQAAENPKLQAAMTGMSHLPGGGPISATRGAQAGQIEQAVKGKVQEIAPTVPTNALTPTSAGTAINEGVKTSRQAMSQAENAAYQKVEALVGKDTPLETPNLDALAKSRTFNPTGIPEVDQYLVSPKAKGLLTATGKSQNGIGFTADIEPGVDKIPTVGPALTYSAIRGMRSKIGSSIDWGLSPTNPGPNGELKQLYGALGADLKEGVKGVSPEAQQAYDAANNLYKTNSNRREILDKVVNKIGGPEKVFQAATNNTKNGATQIGTVMGAMAPDEQNTLRGTILNRLGHKGGAVDQPFDANMYLNNWRSMSPDAKDAIFGPSGQG